VAEVVVDLIVVQTNKEQLVDLVVDHLMVNLVERDLGLVAILEHQM
jgi:hypothetical protein